MEDKNEENENKIILDYNYTLDKMDKGGENKTQILCRCCSRIYEEGKTQIALSSPTTIRPLARIQDIQGLH